MPSTRPEFWAAKFEGNVERDARNAAALEAAGWTVITVWECDLKSDPEAVVSALAETIRGD
ncbi:G:T-mismatch repair DNA endonuclease (very short patch repair protein) [Agrobacterium tumefaciens]|uniref:G:T-mismatch repair DNA endonuclease (Very short patch repair protein) n=2 Tax=Agrobacterium tumefaciens TaxID=358 RepID=A0AAW8M180_AGRTU|nr:G:T-mismatch repair DNA endonuclease (very short patch repair protein) [Agrobacterium tumefaciens]MDR6705138.1 G:T-mismatch repair DNA endonuclease (very short patch repair protein) [Agrobacterium tumefaciens]